MIGYIIYGRLKSTRLPKKGLLKLDNKSLIRIFIEQISTTDLIDSIVFATSDLQEDEDLKNLALDEGLQVYCGYPEDVIMRLYKTAEHFNFEYFLTTMIDGPFQLPEVLNETVGQLVHKNYDMVYSYPGQPNGTDCYGLKTSSVKKIIDLKQTTNTEAWGKYFTDSGLFKWHEINVFKHHSTLKDFRLTIDYPEDYVFCDMFYKDIVSKYGVGFNLHQLIEILQSGKYQTELQKMKELHVKWNTHFQKAITDVDTDIENITKKYP